MDEQYRVKKWEYLQKRSLPLEAKVQLSRRRIRQAYEKFEGKVYISFSGGKDSTVLLHMAREMYPEIPAVFLNTGLEYPEILEFVRTVPNVEWLRPKTTFKDVIEKYGWPIISKDIAQKIYKFRSPTISDAYRQKLLHGCEKGNASKIPDKWMFLIDAPFKISANCCDVLKKAPAHKYEKRTGRIPLIGTMASDSHMREKKYLQHGCNSFDTPRPASMPLSVWTTEDAWAYLKSRKLPYSKIYDMGQTRTGCMFCMFGIMAEEKPRFVEMKRTHPQLHHYCMEVLGCGKILDFLGVSR